MCLKQECHLGCWVKAGGKGHFCITQVYSILLNFGYVPLNSVNEYHNISVTFLLTFQERHGYFSSHDFNNVPVWPFAFCTHQSRRQYHAFRAVSAWQADRAANPSHHKVMTKLTLPGVVVWISQAEELTDYLRSPGRCRSHQRLPMPLSHRVLFTGAACCTQSIVFDTLLGVVNKRTARCQHAVNKTHHDASATCQGYFSLFRAGFRSIWMFSIAHSMLKVHSIGCRFVRCIFIGMLGSALYRSYFSIWYIWFDISAPILDKYRRYCHKVKCL